MSPFCRVLDGQVRLLVEHMGARETLVAGDELRPLADHGAKLGHGARPVPLEQENFTLGEVAFDALGVCLQHFADVAIGLVCLLQQQVHLGQADFGLDDPRVGRVLAQSQALLQSRQGLLGLVQIEVDLAQQDAQLETLRLLRDPFFEDLGRFEGLPLRDVEARRRLPGLLAAGIGRHRIGDQVDGRGLAAPLPVKVGQVELVHRLVRLELDHLAQLLLGLVLAHGVGVKLGQKKMQRGGAGVRGDPVLQRLLRLGGFQPLAVGGRQQDVHLGLFTPCAQKVFEQRDGALQLLLHDQHRALQQQGVRVLRLPGDHAGAFSRAWSGALDIRKSLPISSWATDSSGLSSTALLKAPKPPLKLPSFSSIRPSSS